MNKAQNPQHLHCHNIDTFERGNSRRAAAGRKKMGGGSIWIIKEIYDAENSCEKFECELDLALRKGISTIVIEPPDLAEQTGRWITVGNFFHKTAVVLGLSSMLWFWVCPRQTTVYMCMTGGAVIAASIYTISWQSDPCCRYQVERNPKRLLRLQIPQATTAVVFRKRNNRYRTFLHLSTAALSLGFCMYGVYRHRL